uniref:Uncharacterized protein n=1 Tax=Cacopsylla melanoneura TaxID=428564 RepID=A0A8D8UY87_9HEMI
MVRLHSPSGCPGANLSYVVGDRRSVQGRPMGVPNMTMECGTLFSPVTIVVHSRSLWMIGISSNLHLPRIPSVSSPATSTWEVYRLSSTLPLPPINSLAA